MKKKLLYLLLDTNVLLLWLVGQVDPGMVLKFKRLSLFDETDYSRLQKAIAGFRHLVTTPHVLAEVSNFAGQVPRPHREAVMTALRAFAAEQREHYERAASLVDRSEFPEFGLTDTGLLALSIEAIVLTTDVELYGRILSVGGHAINFNHLRESEPVKRV